MKGGDRDVKGWRVESSHGLFAATMFEPLEMCSCTF